MLSRQMFKVYLDQINQFFKTSCETQWRSRASRISLTIWSCGKTKNNITHKRTYTHPRRNHHLAVWRGLCRHPKGMFHRQGSSKRVTKLHRDNAINKVIPHQNEFSVYHTMAWFRLITSHKLPRCTSRTGPTRSTGSKDPQGKVTSCTC